MSVIVVVVVIVGDGGGFLFLFCGVGGGGWGGEVTPIFLTEFKLSDQFWFCWFFNHILPLLIYFIFYFILNLTIYQFEHVHRPDYYNRTVADWA